MSVEDKVGSIAPGRYADFAVLEQAPCAVAKERSATSGSGARCFGGKAFPASEIRPQ